MTDEVRKPTAAAEGMLTPLPMLNALLGGTASMRAAGKTFLPQWPKEDDKDYVLRLAVAVLSPFYSRTIQILAAKPFSKPLALSDDASGDMNKWLSDCDLQGRNLHAFAVDLMQDCLGRGISGVLVDVPPATTVPKTEAGTTTIEAEKAAGIRPYLIHYPAGSILGWRNKVVAGEYQLTQLRLLETVEEDDGVFGTKTVEQVRVLEPGTWAVWRKVKNASSGKEEWQEIESGTRTLQEIPFVPFYGERAGYMIGKPPLMELAFQNVEHWQSCSDQQTILHVARVPILALSGVTDSTGVTVGASSALNLPQGASAEYVEHSGAAIGAGQTSIKDLEERMRQTGAEMLFVKEVEVTATQTDSENEGNKCALQRITETFESSVNQMLVLMAKWVNESSAPTVTLYKDFGVGSLTLASAQLMLDAVEAGALSNETLYESLQRRGLVSDDTTWEDELKRIAKNLPKNTVPDPASA